MKREGIKKHVSYLALIFLFVFKERGSRNSYFFFLALGIIYLGIYKSSHQMQNLIEVQIVIVRDIKLEAKISYIHTSNVASLFGS